MRLHIYIYIYNGNYFYVNNIYVNYIYIYIYIYIISCLSDAQHLQSSLQSVCYTPFSMFTPWSPRLSTIFYMSSC